MDGKFFGIEETLYDLVKKHSGDDIKYPIADVRISSETEKAVNFALEKRKNEFEEFYQKAGIHLYIEGEITAKTYDPMNIIPLEDRLLHKSFLEVRINNEDYHIQQPVIAYFGNGIQSINRLHLILENKPIENIDSLTIDGVGEIKGRYKKQENTLHLLIN
ncbi:hypothetical protein QUF81_09165 [Peribacillus simplex]|uniref:hypothetical protein n=1 Tax=Peribacillus simplex TaxID=1478 RepID=UPI0025A26CBA|nr:hypothetical protein [Peribacillus simplex]MDM5293349.1 hypothetical protein [Peribacillus simplex]